MKYTGRLRILNIVTISKAPIFWLSHGPVFNWSLPRLDKTSGKCAYPVEHAVGCKPLRTKSGPDVDPNRAGCPVQMDGAAAGLEAVELDLRLQKETLPST